MITAILMALAVGTSTPTPSTCTLDGVSTSCIMLYDVGPNGAVTIGTQTTGGNHFIFTGTVTGNSSFSMDMISVDGAVGETNGVCTVASSAISCRFTLKTKTEVHTYRITPRGY